MNRPQIIHTGGLSTEVQALDRVGQLSECVSCYPNLRNTVRPIVQGIGRPIGDQDVDHCSPEVSIHAPKDGDQVLLRGCCALRCYPVRHVARHYEQEDARPVGKALANWYGQDVVLIRVVHSSTNEIITGIRAPERFVEGNENLQIQRKEVLAYGVRFPLGEGRGEGHGVGLKYSNAERDHALPAAVRIALTLLRGDGAHAAVRVLDCSDPGVEVERGRVEERLADVAHQVFEAARVDHQVVGCSEVFECRLLFPPVQGYVLRADHLVTVEGEAIGKLRCERGRRDPPGGIQGRPDGDVVGTARVG